ncbi:chemotaxis protein [Stappia taiwanensis]|uniref:Chemotaxis protein n=1 Tax=Stappia taiwanensis TaxID=992267 RepID=A0A838XGE0_9HYPH|nr:DUF6468 domain-containing protein [Stappia taiwanensis]MBA4610459.1 chemotaxis protein [Stappia taiwanensis]GGE84780.1 hypothetical protein GCM10007285_10460 [Stappia taiwanensis]
MSTLPVGLIIESLVAILLLVTIGYCVVLNNRLKRLRADEESLRATISELITASEIAERAILGLKATAGEADRTLGERLVEAERLSRELSDQIGEGNTVLERITQIAEAAKPAAQAAQPAAAPAPHEPAPAAPIRASDIRSAAIEASARLEHFRKRAAEQAA